MFKMSLRQFSLSHLSLLQCTGIQHAKAKKKMFCLGAISHISVPQMQYLRQCSWTQGDFSLGFGNFQVRQSGFQLRREVMPGLRHNTQFNLANNELRVSVETYLVNKSAGFNLVLTFLTCNNPDCTKFCM